MPAPDLTGTPLSELTSLNGRAALVTGAGNGLGRAISLRLAEGGAAVAVTDLDADAAGAVTAEIEAAGGKAITIGLDVAASASVDTALRQADAELGGLDILVNNAGVYPLMPMTGFTDEQWRRVQQINLDGAFYCARRFADLAMAAQRPGVIINLSSTTAFTPSSTPGTTAYASSKAALRGFTQALAFELAPAGIRAVAVAPTMIHTPGMDVLFEQATAAGMGDLVAGVGPGLPLGRIGEPDDVARVVYFLATDLAAYITGSTYVVDGGQLLK